MPYDVNKPDDENDPNRQSPGQDYYSSPTAQAAQANSGYGALTSGSSTPAAAPTSFVNFDRYLSANQGTANKLAGDVAGKVGAEGQAATGALDKAQGQFENSVVAGEGQFGGTLGGPEGTSKGSGAQGGGYSEPPDPAPTAANGYGRGGASSQDIGQGSDDRSAQESRHDAQDAASAPGAAQLSIDQGRQLANQKYQGPTDITQTDAYNNASGLVQTANQDANALGQPGGLQGLIGRDYGGSQGANAFDASLAGSVGGSKFAALANQYGNGKLTKQLGSLDAYGQGIVGQAQNNVAGEASRWQGLVDNYDKAQAADAKAKADAASKGKDKKYGTLQDYRDSSTLPSGSNALPGMLQAAGTGSVAGPWGAAGAFVSKGVQDLGEAGVGAVAGQGAEQDVNNVVKYLDPTQWGSLGQNNNQADFSSLGSDDVQGQVYNSMSQAELDSLAGMSADQQKQWLADRKKQLGL